MSHCGGTGFPQDCMSWIERRGKGNEGEAEEVEQDGRKEEMDSASYSLAQCVPESALRQEDNYGMVQSLLEEGVWWWLLATPKKEKKKKRGMETETATTTGGWCG